MDALDSSCVLRPPCGGGIPYRLAGVGPDDVRDCDANHKVPNYQFCSCGCRATAGPSGMETTLTQPRHPLCNVYQRGLFSHPSHHCTEPRVARSLHRHASLPALFLVCTCRRCARWCAANNDCCCRCRWYAAHGERRLGREVAQCHKLWRVALEVEAGRRRRTHRSTGVLRVAFPACFAPKKGDVNAAPRQL